MDRELGVGWDNSRNKWYVRIMIGGNFYNGGRHNSLGLANKVAREIRERYTPQKTNDIKNDYKVIDDIIIIYLDKENGERVECYASLDKLDKLKEFPNKWCLNANGYVFSYLSIDGKSKHYLMHRYLIEAPDSMIVDHIDMDRLNNTDDNLRLTDKSGNAQNVVARRNNKSGFRGVSYHRQNDKWLANVNINGVRHYLGQYNTPEEANIVVRDARKRLMPLSQEALSYTNNCTDLARLSGKKEKMSMKNNIFNSIELNRLYQIDVLDGMKIIPDETIDLTVTDPPYLMNYRSNRRVVQEKFDHIQNDINSHNLISEYIKELYRIHKDNTAIYMFCSWHHIDFFKQEFEKYFNLKNIIVWNKNNHGSGDLRGSYAPKHELILYGHKGRSLFRDKRIPDVIDFAKVPSVKLTHPTEKPVGLLEIFIRNSSDVGDIVFDGFAGSGSTFVAAKKLKRNYIGFEIDTQYIEVANIRLDSEYNEEDDSKISR